MTDKLQLLKRQRIFYRKQRNYLKADEISHKINELKNGRRKY